MVHVNIIDDRPTMLATRTVIDVFIHGDELWRLQKDVITNGDRHSQSLDFTKDEFKRVMPGLYHKVKKYLRNPHQVPLKWVRPMYNDINRLMLNYENSTEEKL